MKSGYQATLPKRHLSENPRRLHGKSYLRSFTDYYNEVAPRECIQTDSRLTSTKAGVHTIQVPADSPSTVKSPGTEGASFYVFCTSDKTPPDGHVATGVSISKSKPKGRNYTFRLSTPCICVKLVQRRANLPFCHKSQFYRRKTMKTTKHLLILIYLSVLLSLTTFTSGAVAQTQKPLQEQDKGPDPAWCEPGASDALRNGSFEEVDGSGRIANWTIAGYKASRSKADPPGPKDGVYFAAIDAGDNLESTTLYQDVEGLEPGHSYEFTIYAIRGPNDSGSVTVGAQYIDSNGNPVGTSVEKSVTATNNWAQYTLDLGPAPKEASFIRIMANAGGKGNGRYLSVDAACMYEDASRSYDWGDLPDTFDTTEDKNGPSHEISPDLYLGPCVDAESDGQPDTYAGEDGAGSGHGDDGNEGTKVEGKCAEPGDDEDGVTLSTPMIPGTKACFKVTAHNGTKSEGILHAWIDWNGDGDFDNGSGDADPGEFYYLRIIPPDTDWADKELCISVPSDANLSANAAFMRFRLTPRKLESKGWKGPGDIGEVEDYWRPLATLGDYVWYDTNANGIQDTGEAGIQGIKAELYQSKDCTGNSIASTTTDSNGNYSFSGLIPGIYSLKFVIPTGYIFSKPNQGNDDTKDSDVNRTTGCVENVNATPTHRDMTIDAGLYPSSSHVFDPATGRKTVSYNGGDVYEWTQVWMNNSNTASTLTVIKDPIPPNSTYVPGSLVCNATGASATLTCNYDQANDEIVWEGTIAPDPGATNANDAQNEVVITFNTTTTGPSVNIACANWDENGDGLVDQNDPNVSSNAPMCTNAADSSTVGTNVVPEPRTILLLLFGIVVLAWYVWSRSDAQRHTL